jgi:hypothetical protein
MLTYVVSFVLCSPVSLNIHNQCNDINLTSPTYFVHGGKWHAVPDQKIGVNAIMRNRLEFDPGQDILDGILTYRIQKQYTESDEPIQDESKHIQLLVAWHVEHTKESHVRVLLVEHDNELDENDLRKLHQKYWHSLKERVDPIKNNWISHDKTVLETTIRLMNENYRWDVFISEGKKKNIERSLWIDTAK